MWPTATLRAWRSCLGTPVPTQGIRSLPLSHRSVDQSDCSDWIACNGCAAFAAGAPRLAWFWRDRLLSLRSRVDADDSERRRATTTRREVEKRIPTSAIIRSRLDRLTYVLDVDAAVPVDERAGVVDTVSRLQ